MGLFSGGNSSSSTTNNYFDDRDVTDYSHLSGILGSGNTIINSTTDAGASQAARDVAVSAIDNAQRTARDATAAMASTADRAFRSADAFVSTTRETYNDALGFADRAQTLAVNSADRAASLAASASDKALTASLGAVQAAKDSATGDRTLMYVALAVVGVVGVAVAFRRG